MGLGLCACFWRSSAQSSVFGQASLTGSRISGLSNLGFKAGVLHPGPNVPVASCVRVQVSSANFGSVLSSSTLAILSLISALVFISPANGIPVHTLRFSLPMTDVHLVNVRRDQAAESFATGILNGIVAGISARLVLSGLSHLFSVKITGPIGFTCILSGRMDGPGTDTKASLDAMSLGLNMRFGASISAF